MNDEEYYQQVKNLQEQLKIANDSLYKNYLELQYLRYRETILEERIENLKIQNESLKNITKGQADNIAYLKGKLNDASI